MIQVRQNPHTGDRHYTTTRALIDVAVAITGLDQRDAIFRLARILPMDHLADVEHLALEVSHEAAIERCKNILARFQNPKIKP